MSSQRGTELMAVRGAPKPPRFSDELRELAARFADRPVSLGDLLAETRGRGYGLLLLLISLPFVTPVPLPGLSMVFGVVVAVIGGRLALGQRPWLPQRLLRRPLPPRFVGSVLTGARWAVRWIETAARPRLDFLHSQTLYRRIAGALIALSGLLLLLPLPLPFTNSLPALTVVLLSAGAIERDGLFFLGGCFAFALGVTYFALLAFGGVQVFDWLRA